MVGSPLVANGHSCVHFTRNCVTRYPLSKRLYATARVNYILSPVRETLLPVLSVRRAEYGYRDKAPELTSVFRRVRKFRKTTVSFVVSVRTEQLGFHWVVFHEIWNFSIFRKYAEEIQVSLESGTNMGYFTWIPMCIYDNMPLNSSWTGKYLIPRLLRKSKYKFYVP
jgi:hypothetical protein